MIYSGSRLSKPRAGSAANDQHQNCIEGSLYFNIAVKPALIDNKQLPPKTHTKLR